MARWSAADIPDQTGRTAVVTGANGGLGFVVARELARHGATVVLACRDAGRGEAAIGRIRAGQPDAEVVLRSLDVSSLDAVARFADTLAGERDSVDLLVNNAGVMAIPQRRTDDGYELQLATNHLGAFALTGRLLPLLLAAPAARVVAVSSVAHKVGRIDLPDLDHDSGYSPWPVYAQSKLANLLFAYELQRRLEAADSPAISLAAHPGFTHTNLVAAGPAMSGRTLFGRVSRLASRVLAQSVDSGALPLLRAATDPKAAGGEFYGPGGSFEAWGPPQLVASTARSHDTELAAALWDESVARTGVRYQL